MYRLVRLNWSPALGMPGVEDALLFPLVAPFVVVEEALDPIPEVEDT